MVCYVLCVASWRTQGLIAPLPGQVVIHSLSTPESYAFDLRRPMRTIALDPQFAKSGARAFVCGGMAGTLVLHEKGWLGHKETELHTGEGPIWTSKWRGNLIAWANDLVSGIVGTCLICISNLFKGGKDIRSRSASTHNVCGPSTRQPACRSLQMQSLLAGRPNAPHCLGRPHQGGPHTHSTPTHNRAIITPSTLCRSDGRLSA